MIIVIDFEKISRRIRHSIRTRFFYIALRFDKTIIRCKNFRRSFEKAVCHYRYRR